MEEDNLLINKYLDGDQDSFKVLIDKYTSSVYNFTVRFVGSINAPDITQEIFIKIWKNLKNFNKDKSQFKTWMFVIARNSITDFLRKKRSIPFSSIRDDEFFEDNILDETLLPDEVYQKIQDKDILLKFLDELSSDYKLVLTLYYQEEMTFKEIGDILSKPLNTVKSYHYRALKILREKIK